jgi:hypothetical protein
MFYSSRTLAVVLAATVTLTVGLLGQILSSSVPGDGDTTELPTLTADLEVMAQISRRRFAAVDELLAGRSTLPQTAATFRHLSRECPYDPVPYLHNLYPGHSDEELHCLHVIRYVEAVRHQGRISEATVESLRQEYEELRRNQAIRLDDAASP